MTINKYYSLVKINYFELIEALLAKVFVNLLASLKKSLTFLKSKK
jgi:hypothetical protein